MRIKRTKYIMIYISIDDYNRILNHCISMLPNEACGLIGGIINENDFIIKKVYLLTNVDNSPSHFSLDPKEQIAAAKDMRENGYELLGNFHSHPETAAHPSKEDIRLANDSNVAYLIMSLIDMKKPVLKAFLIDECKAVTEDIIVIDTD